MATNMESAAAPLPELRLHDEKPIDIGIIAKTWLESFQKKISQDQLEDISDLFIDDCWWRDILALSWDITTKHGNDQVSRYLQSQAIKSGFGQLAIIDQGVLQPRLSDMGLVWIEFGFTFTSKAGAGRGVVRLANVSPSQWKAWIVHTNLDELKSFPESSPQDKSSDYPTKDPQVLIIGAGQSGLALAARLKALNVNALTVDKVPQIGDSWRNRYKTIRTHTPSFTDHYPYLKYPSDHPDFPNQNEIVSWMEHYQKVMDLNVELGVTVGKINYEDSSRRYTVVIKLANGTERVLTPRHVVLATGIISNIPIRPEFENESSFTGQIYHSVEHKSASLLASDLAAKKVVIVGAGTSAHDIAQDFVNCGAKEVTLIQRSAMFVLSEAAQSKFMLAAWQMMPTKDADLVGNSFPMPISLSLGVDATKMMAQHDAELLAGVEKAGVVLKRGEDGIGFLHQQIFKLGHFYIDQGAGEMVADGRIKIQRCQEGVKKFDHNAVILANDKRVEADIVVLATGHEPCSAVVEKIMGKEFMAKIGRIGELDEELERIGWWRPTTVPGFWYMTGSFLWSRSFSKPLALQIKAIEEGLNPEYY